MRHVGAGAQTGASPTLCRIEHLRLGGPVRALSDARAYRGGVSSDDLTKRPRKKSTATANEKGRPREEFDANTRRRIAQSAMYVCSNPACLRLTGYATAEGKARAIAQAAHVIPAALKGPRAEQATSSTPNVKSEQNGIWLCLNCHGLVDDDSAAYPAERLFAWRQQHLDLMRSLVGQTLEWSLLALGEARSYMDYGRQFLQLLDERRAMFGDLGREMPAHVNESLQEIRGEIRRLKASVRGESTLADALQTVQDAILRFMDAVNAIDLNRLVATSGEADWETFAGALGVLRDEVFSAVEPLAQEQDFTFRHFYP